MLSALKPFTNFSRKSMCISTLSGDSQGDSSSFLGGFLLDLLFDPLEPPPVPMPSLSTFEILALALAEAFALALGEAFAFALAGAFALALAEALVLGVVSDFLGTSAPFGFLLLRFLTPALNTAESEGGASSPLVLGTSSEFKLDLLLNNFNFREDLDFLPPPLPLLPLPLPLPFPRRFTPFSSSLARSSAFSPSWLTRVSTCKVKGIQSSIDLNGGGGYALCRIEHEFYYTSNLLFMKHVSLIFVNRKALETSAFSPFSTLECEVDSLEGFPSSSVSDPPDTPWYSARRVSASLTPGDKVLVALAGSGAAKIFSKGWVSTLSCGHPSGAQIKDEIPIVSVTFQGFLKWLKWQKVLL